MISTRSKLLFLPALLSLPALTLAQSASAPAAQAPVTQAQIAALQQAGVEAQLEIIPHQGHGIIAPPAAAKKIYAFFNRHLLPPARP